MILTGAGVSANRRSFIVLEIADEDRAFEVARRIAERTGREVTVRDVELGRIDHNSGWEEALRPGSYA